MKTLFAYAAFALLIAVGTPIALSAHALAASDTGSKSSSTTSSTKSGSKTAMAKNQNQRSEASIACSKDADAKGLHGKARQDFRRDCMKQHQTSTH